MRRIASIVIALMGISILLVPFNTLHAHISPDHDQTVLHSGHSHDLTHEETAHELHADDHIVMAKLAVADNGSALTVTKWMPVFWVLALLALGLTAGRENFRPPADDLRTIYRQGWRRPPLRGPPVLSI